MKKTTGFSLIELLVVVAILGILAGIAVPSFVAQVNNSRIDDAESALRQAVGRARGISMRNEVGVFEEELSTVVCYSNSTISVHSASRNNTGVLTQAVCTSDPIWSQDGINSDIEIYTVTYNASRAEQAFVQIAFNNKGLIITACPAGIDCAVNNLFQIKLSGTSYQSDEKVIY